MQAAKQVENAYLEVVRHGLEDNLRHGTKFERLAFRADLEAARYVRKTREVGEREGWERGVHFQVREFDLKWCRELRKKYGG